MNLNFVKYDHAFVISPIDYIFFKFDTKQLC